MMSNNEKQEVAGKVEAFGFDYAFRHYSSFDEIKDAKFHDLRKKYVQSAKEFAEYLGLADC